MQEQVKLIQSFSTHCEWDELNNKTTCPTGVAVNSLGGYVCADYGSSAVKIFDADGTLRDVITSNKLQMAWDVALTNTGKYMVSDPKGGDIKVFSKKGKYLATSTHAHLVEPYGIHYDLESKETGITDRRTACVYIHNPQGTVTEVLTGKEKGATNETYICSLSGKTGSVSSYDNPELQFPSYITMDMNKDIIVSDSVTNAIYKFSQAGSLVWVYGEPGSEDYQLQNPCGVCVDPYNNILVADTANYRIHLLTPNGEFVDYVLTWEDGIADPQALTINHHGHLVLTEASTGQVKVFDYRNKFYTASSNDMIQWEVSSDSHQY